MPFHIQRINSLSAISLTHLKETQHDGRTERLRRLPSCRMPQCHLEGTQRPPINSPTPSNEIVIGQLLAHQMQGKRANGAIQGYHRPQLFEPQSAEEAQESG